MKKLLICCWLAVFAVFTCGAAVAAFDPVNDDTDIFLANPTITAERPNVLIILDNTANWNNAFSNEKSALVAVVNGLSESYNVGLMLFPETGNPNDNVDGGYMKFGVRQMTSANKSALASIVDGLDITNDKGNNATTGLAMYEAYLYYAGNPSLASFGKAKTDYTGNTTYNSLAATLSYNNDSPATRSGNALPASPTSSSLYNSPIADGCQKSFIIYISNGPANENASARSAASDYLATLTGSDPPNTISITPVSVNGQQGNWADEMAQYMANADVSTAKTGSQNIITYTVEVDPDTTGGGPDMTALLKSMASVGKGKYFAVTSGASGTAIVDALNKIFSEVQAVNSVFASTTLPVSVNVRGTNLNQVYIGVFRPDSLKSPRWLGNLKLYNLVLDAGSIYLADQAGFRAEDAITGFISGSATSFWTSSALTPTEFWAYRTAEQNGVGGTSDAPDGDLVEKGGVAQQIRHYYEDETAQALRKLYTCTTGGDYPDCVACTAGGTGTAKTCTSGSELRDTPFDTNNTAISVAALNLTTQAVASLTGKRTTTITALADRKPATLTRSLASGNSATATTISSGSAATTRTISTLTTTTPVSISNITSGSYGTSSTTTTALTWTFTLTKKSGNNPTWNITTGATPTAPAGQTFTNAPTITSAVSGNTTILSIATGTCNGITTPTLNISSAVPAGTGANASPSGSARWEATGTENSGTSCTVTLNLASTYSYTSTTTSSTATVTTATPHGYLSGQSVTVSASNSAFNCTAAGITVVSATSFTCTIPVAQYSSGSPAITGTVTGVSQIITATSAAHGYAAGDNIIISGANPSGYNGTYTVLTNTSTVATVGKDAVAGNNFSNVTGWPALTSNTFALVKATNSTANLLTANTGSPVYAVKTTGDTTISSLTLTFASNPFSNTNVLSLSGAAVGNYNVAAPATCTVTSVTATTATCSLSTSVTGPLPDDTAGTATAASDAVYDITVTATVTAHGFANGAQIVVDSVSNADTGFVDAPGPYTISFVDADHFTFTTAFITAPTGSYNVRLNSPLAYVTATAHGFSSGDAVTIAGATPVAYNLTTAASGFPTQASNLMMIDADHFTYPLPSVPGAATVMGTASILTTTARVNAVNHGFTDGASIAISGATPSAFNDTWAIKLVDSSNFIYCLNDASHDFTASPTCAVAGTPQGDATGSIVAVASSAGASLRNDIINWVRGADNFENENNDCTLSPHFPCVPTTNDIARMTDIRASIHGDVLHSRPAVINYNRHDTDNDVYVFYGANDGIFHAVQGGMATDVDDPDNLTAGQEAWGFIPKEFFGSLQRLRNNSPAISRYNKKPYFADGPIGVYTKDTDGNDALGDVGDVVNLYIGMRRGGRFIYSLNVRDPIIPEFKWQISNSTTGFEELGQTWSEPKVVEDINGYTNPVLIFGAGYDDAVEDIDPSTITSTTVTSLTTAAGTVSRTMGRGIYVVDAITGEKIVSIGGTYSGRATVNDTSTASSFDKIVSGMDFSIPSDVTVIQNLSGGATNRVYVGDTGGNVWRLDFASSYDATSAATRAAWVTVTKIASVTDQNSNAGRRKFFYPPDVVAGTGFDAILIGSGDREHPFDTTVVNRMYMFKDRGTDLGPYTGTSADLVAPVGADYPTITTLSASTTNGGTTVTVASTANLAVGATISGVGIPVGATIASITDATSFVISAAATADGSGVELQASGLYDATNNCLQQACTGTTTALEAAKLAAASGWYVTLGSGEKVIGNAVALGGTVFFNTNQPSSTAGGGSCGSNLGIARQYQVAVADATATSNLDPTNAAFTLADRSKIHAGGGYLPSPVHVVVSFNVDGQTVTKEAVISGTEVSTPTQTPLMTRYRKYWYKEIDQ